MNCKPGDLAICVYAPWLPELLGRIVRITRPFTEGNFPSLHWHAEPITHGPGGSIVVWRDRDMRPIRDNDGEDETIRWAGKPQKETA